MYKFLTVMAFLMTSAVYAGEYHVLDVDRLDLEAYKLDPNNRDPYAPQYTGRWDERAALKWDISSFGLLYWNNNVHMDTVGDGNVPKTVGWEWELGLHMGKYFDLFEYHHSRHIMDEAPQSATFPNSISQFPVENAIGIRFKFIPSAHPHNMWDN